MRRARSTLTKGRKESLRRKRKRRWVYFGLRRLRREWMTEEEKKEEEEGWEITLSRPLLLLFFFHAHHLNSHFQMSFWAEILPVSNLVSEDKRGAGKRGVTQIALFPYLTLPSLSLLSLFAWPTLSMLFLPSFRVDKTTCSLHLSHVPPSLLFSLSSLPLYRESPCDSLSHYLCFHLSLSLSLSPSFPLFILLLHLCFSASVLFLRSGEIQSTNCWLQKRVPEFHEFTSSLIVLLDLLHLLT